MCRVASRMVVDRSVGIQSSDDVCQLESREATKKKVSKPDVVEVKLGEETVAKR